MADSDSSTPNGAAEPNSYCLAWLASQIQATADPSPMPPRSTRRNRGRGGGVAGSPGARNPGSVTSTRSAASRQPDDVRSPMVAKYSTSYGSPMTQLPDKHTINGGGSIGHNAALVLQKVTKQNKRAEERAQDNKRAEERAQDNKRAEERAQDNKRAEERAQDNKKAQERAQRHPATANYLPSPAVPTPFERREDQSEPPEEGRRGDQRLSSDDEVDILQDQLENDQAYQDGYESSSEEPAPSPPAEPEPEFESDPEPEFEPELEPEAEMSTDSPERDPEPEPEFEPDLEMDLDSPEPEPVPELDYDPSQEQSPDPETQPHTQPDSQPELSSKLSPPNPKTRLQRRKRVWDDEVAEAEAERDRIAREAHLRKQRAADLKEQADQRHATPLMLSTLSVPRPHIEGTARSYIEESNVYVDANLETPVPKLPRPLRPRDGAKTQQQPVLTTEQPRSLRPRDGANTQQQPVLSTQHQPVFSTEQARPLRPRDGAKTQQQPVSSTQQQPVLSTQQQHSLSTEQARPLRPRDSATTQQQQPVVSTPAPVKPSNPLALGSATRLRPPENRPVVVPQSIPPPEVEMQGERFIPQPRPQKSTNTAESRISHNVEGLRPRPTAGRGDAAEDREDDEIAQHRRAQERQNEMLHRRERRDEERRDKERRDQERHDEDHRDQDRRGRERLDQDRRDQERREQERQNQRRRPQHPQDRFGVVRNWGTSLWSNFGALWSSIGSFLSNIGSFLSNIGSLLWSSIGALWSSIGSFLSNICSLLGSSIGSLLTSIGSLLSNTGSLLSNLGSNIGTLWTRFMNSDGIWSLFKALLLLSAVFYFVTLGLSGAGPRSNTRPPPVTKADWDAVNDVAKNPDNISPESQSRLASLFSKIIMSQRDETGKVTIDDNVWAALKEKMLRDKDVASGILGSQLRGPKWNALLEQVKASIGSPGLSWDDFFKKDEKKLKKAIKEAIKEELPAAVKDKLPAHGATPADISREVKKALANERTAIQAQMEKAQKTVDSLAQEVSKIKPSPGMSKDDVSKLVQTAVKKAVGDAKLESAAKTGAKSKSTSPLDAELHGRMNHFAFGNGVQIDVSLTSPTWVQPPDDTGLKSWRPWARTKSAPPHQRPRFIPERWAALTPWDDAGDCWCAGIIGLNNTVKPADLGIQLGQLVIPEYVVIEHIHPDATVDAAAMPKDFEVWAIVAGGGPVVDRVRDWAVASFPATYADETVNASPSIAQTIRNGFVKLGEFTYRHVERDGGVMAHHLSPELSTSLKAATDQLIIRAVNNMGADHTCFYRVRLYGEVVGLVQNVAAAV